MSLADAALYRAKEGGRNRVELTPTAAGIVVLEAADRRRLGSAASPKLMAIEPTG